MRIPEYQSRNLSKNIEYLYYIPDDDSLNLKCTSLGDEEIIFKLTELDNKSVRVKLLPSLTRGAVIIKDKEFLGQLKLFVDFVMSDINRKYK